MLYLCWILSVICAFGLGFGLRNLHEDVQEVKKAIAQKIDKPEVEEESPSEILDPYDEVAEAKYAMEQEMARLNKIK